MIIYIYIYVTYMISTMYALEINNKHILKPSKSPFANAEFSDEIHIKHQIQ